MRAKARTICHPDPERSEGEGPGGQAVRSTRDGLMRAMVLIFCHPDPERSEGEGPGGRAVRLRTAAHPDPSLRSG